MLTRAPCQMQDKHEEGAINSGWGISCGDIDLGCGVPQGRQGALNWVREKAKKSERASPREDLKYPFKEFGVAILPVIQRFVVNSFTQVILRRITLIVMNN